jgi:aspartate 1-decarboxylase
MAYKVFVNGYPLNASELNQYLMNQSIAVFVDATARDNAIETPVEGQFAYLTGTDALVKYDGSAWVDAISLPSPTVSEQTGTTYTIVAGDAQSTVFVNNASGTTVTIDDEIAIGERVDFVQKGAGAITFAAGSGVTLNSKDSLLSTAAQYAAATVIKEATNTYYLIGNLA